MAKQKQTTHKPFSKPFYKLLGGCVLGLALVYGGIVWANLRLDVCKIMNGQFRAGSVCVKLGTDTTTKTESITIPANNAQVGVKGYAANEIGKTLRFTNKHSNKEVFIPTRSKAELLSVLKAKQSGKNPVLNNIEICEVGLLSSKPSSFKHGIKGCKKTIETKDKVVFDADYMVVRYKFEDGRDLDMRVRVASPSRYMTIYREERKKIPFRYLGFGGQKSEKDLDKKVITEWGGDNQGTGEEAVLINLKTLEKSSRKSLLSFTLDFRAFWWVTPGRKPVKIYVQMFKGGKMVKKKLSATSSAYTWVNPTATDSLEFYTNGKVLPGPTCRHKIFRGHRIGTFTYTYATKKGVFNLNDTTEFTPELLKKSCGTRYSCTDRKELC